MYREISSLPVITNSVLLAGMSIASGPRLVAAVTNAGGLGVLGGITFRTLKQLKDSLDELKSYLDDPNAPFGVNLLLPQVGGNARKTNSKMFDGELEEFVELIISSGARLFVSAIGVPPKSAVDRFHEAGIPVMNMVGKPQHAIKALSLGVDIICVQGGEAGGHTGTIPTSLLIPATVDAVKGYKSPLTGEQVQVIATGGIYDGRGLAAALSYGATAVWVGTRFVATIEAGVSDKHKQDVISAGFDDTVRTLVFTGRPVRVRKNEYVMDWENNKADEIKRLTSKGIVPFQKDIKETNDKDFLDKAAWHMMGISAAVVNDIKPAKQIVDEIVSDAIEAIKRNVRFLAPNSKL